MRSELIVEHLYDWWWVGALHIWIMKKMYGDGKDGQLFYHSRFVDLRIELIPQQLWVHLIPMFSDNYAYLVVRKVVEVGGFASDENASK